MNIDLQLFGGRGASSSASGNTAGLKRAENIRDTIIETKSNSRFKGVARQAIEGTGNYRFKNYKAVTADEIVKDVDYDTSDFPNINGGVTIAYGYRKSDGAGVFYANKSDSKEIKAIENETKRKRERLIKETENPERPEIRTTTTYDRWRKRNQRNFDAWYGRR